MRSDTFIQAADWHVRHGIPCQDHVLVAGTNNVAVVADGCSSGEGSDYGAMAVARTVVSMSAALPLSQICQAGLTKWQEYAGATDSAMLATALRLEVSGGDAIFSAMGDGLGGVLDKDGGVWAWCIDWSNMPPYPWYTAMGQMGAWSQERSTGVLTIWQDGDVVETRLLDGNDPEVVIIAPSNWGSAWIGTDGWLTLGVNVPEIARQATAFKNKEGAFLKRRLGRWLQTLGKSGVYPTDDISMAAIQRET
jgi:hypothetical protein